MRMMEPIRGSTFSALVCIAILRRNTGLIEWSSLGGSGENGRPGLAIYREGSYLGATVSTGPDTWDFQVQGYVPMPGVWIHIGVRWKEPITMTSWNWRFSRLANEVVGGAEIFVDMVSVGHLVFPNYRASSNHAGSEEPWVAVGCHMSWNMIPMGHSSGCYDEIAFFDHQLKDKELFKLKGGYGQSAKVFRTTFYHISNLL